MRRLLSLVAALAFAAPGLTSAAGSGFSVPLDHVVRLPLRGQAVEVVVGSPRYLDVSVVDANTVLVHGKDVGNTNLMIYDAAGRLVFNERVAVLAPTGDQVTISRAAKSSEYACGDRCEERAARDENALSRARVLAPK